MKKDTHANLKNVLFVCSSCNSKIELMSTLDQDQISIDVCSACHPFYLGISSQHQIKGRSEKLLSKFETGKSNILTQNKIQEKENKKIKKNKTKQVITSFENL